MLLNVLFRKADSPNRKSDGLSHENSGSAPRWYNQWFVYLTVIKDAAGKDRYKHV